ncbi:unnamed protein product, partial [Rotaria sp. Silwood2]
MTQFNLSSQKLTATQNHDDFAVFWLSSSDEVLSELAVQFDHSCRMYDSYETCVDAIVETRSEGKIFLVVMNVQLESYFNDFPQIRKIYVLSKDSQNVKSNKQNYSKLVDIFSEKSILMERLHQDILLTYRNDLPVTISCLSEYKNEQSLTGIRGNTLMFLWDQFFSYHIVHSLPVDMTQLKIDMIEQCRIEYENNSIQLDKIKQFEINCTSDNALQWYSEDSFAYRLLNRAFRTRNIDFICKFRYFIILLYTQLRKLSQEEHKENYPTLYRGQKMNKTDLEKFQSNVGHLISWNSFLSTSRNRNVAEMFSGGSETDFGVIFEINMQNATHDTWKPFADISVFSSISDEQEVLFFIGTVFLVESVEEQQNSVWIIKLTLNKETDGQLNQIRNIFTQHLHKLKDTHQSFMNTDDFTMLKRYYPMLTGKLFSLNDLPSSIINLPLGYLLGLLGHYDKAIEFYKSLLFEKNFIDIHKFIIIHVMIGYNYFHLSQYYNALLCYLVALSLINHKNLLIGEIYHHIGDVWRAMNYFKLAQFCYEETLEILGDEIDNRRLAYIYRIMSDLHKKQGNENDAIVYEQEANNIDPQYGSSSTSNHEQLLKHQHELETRHDITPLERAGLLYKIGLCLIKEGDYSAALEVLLQTEQLFLEHRPETDCFVDKFATLYENLALTYLFLDNHLKAL